MVKTKFEGFLDCKFDGCMFGLVSKKEGKPIKKPWLFKTTMETLCEAFHDKTCDASHQHAPCAGQDTQATEQYTPAITEKVHKAFFKAVAANSKVGGGNDRTNKVKSFAAPAVLFSRASKLFSPTNSSQLVSLRATAMIPVHLQWAASVSYTHLTLPTSDLV